MQVSLRLRAAAWTAAIALIPAAIAAQQWLKPNGLGAFVDMQKTFSVAGMTLIAVAAAGVSGYLLAEPLLDPDLLHDGVTAVTRGIVTALLAYLLFCFVVVIIMMTPTYWAGVMTPIEVIVSVFGSPLFGLFYGLLTTGWYTLPVAGAAGYLLSRMYRKQTPRGS